MKKEKNKSLIFKKRRKNQILKASKLISKLSDVASIVVSLKNKPRSMDLFMIGFRIIGLALDTYNEYHENDNNNLSAFDYFHIETENGAVWHKLPITLKKKIGIITSNKKIIFKSKDFYVIEAFVDNIKIGWVSKDGESSYGSVYFLIEKNETLLSKKEELIQILSEKLWLTFETKNLVITKDNIKETYLEDNNIVSTNSMENLHKRVKKFKEEGYNRSYLIEGKPGLGKSTAILYIIKKLSLKSLRIDMDMFGNELFTQDMNQYRIVDIKNIISYLRPEAIIMDDIDRIDKQFHGHLFDLLQFINKNCKIFFATVNDKTKLVPALLRPGRFDEHHVFENIKKEIIEKIVGRKIKEELIKELEKFPIAYIAEFAKRDKVLGKEFIEKEFKELKERVENLS